MKFNDPFDSMICWRKDVVDRYFDDEKCGSVLAKLRLWDAECVALSLSNCFRISCFSEICSSPIMWAHYADNCRGFCVGYEMHPAFAEIIDIGSGQDLKRCEGSIFPVIYSNRRQDATQAMIREIEYAVASERGALDEIDLSHYDQLEPYKTSLFKSQDWEVVKFRFLAMPLKGKVIGRQQGMVVGLFAAGGGWNAPRAAAGW